MASTPYQSTTNFYNTENPGLGGLGAMIGDSATALVGFYGVTPVAQRAAAAQATSLVGTASSTAIDTATKAALIEVMNTLNGLGIWKGSA